MVDLVADERREVVCPYCGYRYYGTLEERLHCPRCDERIYPKYVSNTSRGFAVWFQVRRVDTFLVAIGLVLVGASWFMDAWELLLVGSVLVSLGIVIPILSYYLRKRWMHENLANCFV